MFNELKSNQEVVKPNRYPGGRVTLILLIIHIEGDGFNTGFPFEVDVNKVWLCPITLPICLQTVVSEVFHTKTWLAGTQPPRCLPRYSVLVKGRDEDQLDTIYMCNQDTRTQRIRKYWSLKADWLITSHVT